MDTTFSQFISLKSNSGARFLGYVFSRLCLLHTKFLHTFRRDLTTASLQYLSADQALADLAYFIEYLKQKGDIEEGQAIAVFGGSYPGNLAAWARYKYPHLIKAAVSSSAPVQAKADFVGE